MNGKNTDQKVKVSQEEYKRLKEIEDKFKKFWNYLEYVMDIREARKEKAEERIISQEKLFKELGI